MLCLHIHAFAEAQALNTYHGFSASICEICAICGQKKAKLTEGQRPKPYEFSGFTALNTYASAEAGGRLKIFLAQLMQYRPACHHYLETRRRQHRP
jgi:hypothetical protein